jgi:glycosyltransferase involved in cell wall biosynthesis
MTRASVLLVSNHGEIVGGGEISLLGLLEHLDRTRWNPQVAVPEDGALAHRSRSMGLPVHVMALPTFRQPRVGVIRAVQGMRRLIRDTGAGLLHANGTRAMLYAGLAGRLARRPVIWHVRVADPEPSLDRLLFWLSRAVIVNSRAVAKRFAWGRAHKVHCIHNGVDLTRFTPRSPSPRLRTSLGIPDGVPVIASIGRFVPYKGYRFLLEAARLVEDRLPGVHWLVIGDGEQREELQSRCRNLGLSRQVHFTGWREDVAELLALCTVFALPSLGEHFGRVVIEAMAMEKAVVATGTGGVPEIVLHDECGLLVRPADPGAMADALLDLLRDPGRAARFGRVGRERVEAHFGIARHVEAVSAVYSLVLGSPHGRV